jgi:formylmethanofuran dehydrogenase subunit B
MNAASEVDFTCAFCGLVCDDLRVRVDGTTLQVSANGCEISERALRALSAPSVLSTQQRSARLNGAPVALEQATARAAAILREAAQPLLAGLATDIAGARAVMRLARRCGAVTDHMNFGAKMRNVLVTQDRGWITTTFAEVKQRADVVLIVGGDPARRMPRFFERLIDQPGGLFGEFAAREVILIGAGQAPQLKRANVTPIAAANDALGEILAVLRMLVSEHPASARLPVAVGGMTLERLRALAQQLRSAKYAVLVWAAPDFDFPHAELTIQRIAELVKDINKFTRCAGLPLGGNDGDLSMNQVHVWQSGMALRSDFGGGAPDYDPHANSAAGLLASGDADALLWISSFSAERLPPRADVPTIVLGRPDMQLAQEPEVFIPVGTPGVDHAGHFVRSDKVVTMRLGTLRQGSLPSVAEVVGGIERAMLTTEHSAKQVHGQDSPLPQLRERGGGEGVSSEGTQAALGSPSPYPSPQFWSEGKPGVAAPRANGRRR